jgi:class 3 adenylate cyclase/tetratricopeptide (TPR) repeat protein
MSATDHTEPRQTSKLEMAHVLFMDIVGYSKLPMDHQEAVLRTLQRVVSATPQFLQAQASQEIIRLPTGDGMALVFFEDAEASARCALEVSRALRSHPEIPLRMGLHSGPVYRVKDINANQNVAGGGINIAQRVMDCGDAGHILASQSVADVLEQLSSWKDYLHDLGEAEVKHGVRVHLYNLHTNEAGNSALPNKVATLKPAAEAGLKPAQKSKRLRGKIATAATILVVGLAVGGWLFFSRKAHALTDKDTIVLAEFTNTTGDPVFDGTLRQGLSVQLEQSPFLSIIAEQQIQQTLRMMGQKPDVKLTPSIARELCQRTGSAAVLNGSIAQIGTQYLLTLKAVNCESGESLASTEAQAADKNHVLAALGKTTSEIRNKLGESLNTVRAYNTPLMDATTPSLDALNAYTVGLQKGKSNDAAAVPFFKRAIELDPEFASAYSGLATSYLNLGESGLARENFTKAFALHDHVSERERFLIAARYYNHVTGELPKAIETYQLWTQAYPRDAGARANLGTLYGASGQYEKSIAETQEAILLEPNAGANYSNLLLAQAALDRFDDARNTFNLATAKKIEDPILRVNWFGVAFVLGDTAEMQKQLAWSAAKPQGEDNFLAAKSDAESYYGHIKIARAFSKKAFESALRDDEKETAAQWRMDEALREVECGNRPIARQETAAARALTSSHDTEILAAIALGRAGDVQEAEKLAKDLEKQYPLDTLVNDYWLPVIRASGEIARNNPAKAIELLLPSAPYELASPVAWSGLGGPMYPAYLRGEAYLQLRQGTDAAAEYQKILDNPGFMMACPLGALAQLGMARSFLIAGDPARARSCYQKFLTLWQDADPDVPILIAAKAEYAKLQ